MLNCCIRRKVGREGAAETTDKSTKEDENNKDDTKDDDSDTDYEEFYECEEEEGGETVSEKKTDIPVWCEPEGRAGRVGDLKLLTVDSWLYLPHLQEPPPLTGDQLLEQEQLLLQLGTDKAGQEVR